jgi:hypothetical protein
MPCEACGADLPGAETCLDRFHLLLAVESDNAELRRMHGLTVLTYYLQHSSLTKPWYQMFGAEVMRRVFAQGEDWSSVLLESHPRGVGRTRSAVAVAQLKTRGETTMPDWVIVHAIPGELTVASIDLNVSPGQTEQVEAWARSVAEHRVLNPIAGIVLSEIL